MLRLKTIPVALLLAVACSGVSAGDFVPRSGNGFAPVGDDPGARAAGAEAADIAAMGESEATTVPGIATTPAHAHAAVARPVARVGADAATLVRPAQPAGEDDRAAPAPPVPAHKSHASRWQSLLPGVMK